MRFPVLVTIAFFLFSGCALPPREELQSAREHVARAYAAGAHHLSTEEYLEASRALHKGEELVLQRKYARAKDILPLAEERARVALALSLEKRAAQAQSESPKGEEIKPSPPVIKPQPQAKPPPPLPKPGAAPPSSPKKEQPKPGPKAAPAPPPAKKNQPEPESQPAPAAPKHHAVEEGETLWSIAARKDIYSDALLWPLLYQANRDQIKDPQQIYPGQALIIPREITSKEKEDAREKARTSEIFPIDMILKKHDMKED